MGRNDNPKIDLFKAFLQFEGNMIIDSTCYNHDLKGGIKFSGYSLKDDKKRFRGITLDKSQVEQINECNTILQTYNCYKEMEYF